MSIDRLLKKVALSLQALVLVLGVGSATVAGVAISV